MSIRERKWTSGGVERKAWVVDYKDGQGKRRLKTFDKKKDAKAWWETHAAPQIRAGTFTADSVSKTVAAAGELWIARAETNGRERSTVDGYRQHLRFHIKPLLGGHKLSQLTTPVVQEFVDKLGAGGWIGPDPARSRRGLGARDPEDVERQPMSRPMVRKVLGSLKMLLADAQRRGLVAQNVAQPVRLTVNRRARKRLEVGRDIPTSDEIKAILHHAPDRWRPLLITAVFTGLRASELRGLRWENVDFDAKLIRVRERADRYGELGDPKSESGHRDVPMTPLVLNTLREWKGRCPRRDTGKRDGDGEPIKVLDLVFPNGNGNVESLANIWNRGLEPAQIAAGVVVASDERDAEGEPVMGPKYGMHALRHWHASWLINKKADGGLGLDPKRVQERLGHAGIQITLDTYGHLFPAGADDWSEMEAAEQALFQDVRDKDATSDRNKPDLRVV